jgi:hypothetical protein
MSLAIPLLIEHNYTYFVHAGFCFATSKRWLAAELIDNKHDRILLNSGEISTS